MWVVEMWHGFFLVLCVAFGLAALTSLSCVAMAGIDAVDDDDVIVRTADLTPHPGTALTHQ
jgi:hypothetical protein